MSKRLEVIDLHFSGIEEYAAVVQGWSLDFRPLSCSDIGPALQQIISPQVFFTRTWIENTIDQRGCSPEGFRTFAVLEAESSGISWCHQYADSESLIIFPRSGEYSSVSHKGFHVYPFSIKEELLETQANLLFSKDWWELVGSEGQVLTCDTHKIKALRQILRTFSWLGKSLAGDLVALQEHLQQIHIEEELVGSLLECIYGGEAKPDKVSANKKHQYLSRVREYIESNPADIPTASQLASIAGVSVRTLERVFKEKYGVTPKAYLMCMRLNTVHRNLYQATDSGVQINEIASRQGFWHMGQFAADYKKLFGELPSETYRRGR